MRHCLLIVLLLHVLCLTECVSSGSLAARMIRNSRNHRLPRHALDTKLNSIEQQQAGYPAIKACPFDAHKNSRAMAGDVFDHHSIATNESECKSACLRQTDFFCAGALLRNRACYLTGFRMRRDYWSTHFVRTCDDTSNVGCYAAVPGWSVVHSKDYAIPWFMNQRQTRLYFCMALCNENSSCVGFDLKDHGRRPQCHLSQLVTIDETLRFDVHIRRC